MLADPAERVLILDFDFFSAIGGGQTFYRRVVERHPDIEFWYPSRGADVRSAARGELPANARPFAFDAFCSVGEAAARSATSEADAYGTRMLARMATALQGLSFGVADVPSFFPVAHLVRPTLAAYGVVVGRVALGLLGWVSVGIRNGFGGVDVETVGLVAASEAASVAAADVTYVISESHAAENPWASAALVIDCEDALERFPKPSLRPPGSGPPDLWYVGRLDRNKGPDLFLEIAAQVPRPLFGRCLLAGPDNPGAAGGGRWSEIVMDLARRLGLDAVYRGAPSDADLRREVYAGRSVLVVPSRSDAFNYVAVEALANGCPMLLSRHAGAAGFLAARHPAIAPPVIDPEDVDASAAALTALLAAYEERAVALRASLRARPFPRAGGGFMWRVYRDAPVADRHRSALPRLRASADLLCPPAQAWRPRRTPAMATAGMLVVVVRDAPAALAATLASAMRQAAVQLEIVVVDDGSEDPRAVRDAWSGFDTGGAFVRQGPRGFAAAADRGWRTGRHPLVWFAAAGDILEPRLAADGVRAMERPDTMAFRARWDVISGPSPAEPGAAGFDPRDGAWWSGPGLVLRRRALEEAGGLDASLGRWAVAGLLQRLPAAGCVSAPRDAGLRAWRPVPFAGPTRADAVLYQRMLAKTDGIGEGLGAAPA